MRYNLASGHIFADADLGPKVLAKGLIHFLPKTIKGRDEVARIYKKFAEEKGKMADDRRYVYYQGCSSGHRERL